VRDTYRAQVSLLIMTLLGIGTTGSNPLKSSGIVDGVDAVLGQHRAVSDFSIL